MVNNKILALIFVGSLGLGFAVNAVNPDEEGSAAPAASVAEN